MKHHTPDAVREAAVSGCPFFVLLWEGLQKNKRFDPEEYQELLEETTLFWNLKAVKLVHVDPSQERYEITECGVQADRGNWYCWYPLGPGFTAFSDWGTKSLFDLSLQRLT